MLPDRVSNPGPLTYESGTLPIALRGPATFYCGWNLEHVCCCTRCWLNAFIVFHKLQFCEGFRYVFDGVRVEVFKC